MTKLLIRFDYVVIIISILFLVGFYINYIHTDSIQDSRFSGNADSFGVNGQGYNFVHFKAKEIVLRTNETVFKNAKNITIENTAGETISINYSPYLQVLYEENILESSQFFSNVDINIYLENPTINKNLNIIYLKGIINNVNLTFLNGEEVILIKYVVKNVIIGDKKFTDFERISFYVDSTSAAESHLGKVELNASTISDLNFITRPSGIILNDGEGVLRLNDHLFDIRNADTLDVEEIAPNSSYFIVNDKKIKFVGTSNSVKLNNQNIIMNDFFYWLKFKPEIISGFGVFIAAALALLSIYFPVRQEIIKNKDEKQRILNVLFAEFKTNKKFIEYLKNSIDDMIKNPGEIQVKFGNFIFLGFRDDGFNTFRNLGGFQYIETELYDKIANYYVISYKIHKKFDKIFSDKELYKLNIKDLMPDIESIESLNEQMRNELENEIQKT